LHLRLLLRLRLRLHLLLLCLYLRLLLMPQLLAEEYEFFSVRESAIICFSGGHAFLAWTIWDKCNGCSQR
jgi:hypothetical protein